MKLSSYPLYFIGFIVLAIVMLTSGCSQTEKSAVVSDNEPGEIHTLFLPGMVPLEMVWIPPGNFMMGSPDDEQERISSEGLLHEVTFAKGFWMGKYPITQAQWQAIMGNNPSEFKGDNRPVEQVSWNDIRKSGFLGFRKCFLDKLNALHSDCNFRLPSEAEWEYAYRAGTTTRFYWGEDLDATEIDDYAWYGDNSSSSTKDVGLKLPNVWEWCEDDWHSNYYGAPKDGSAWVDSPRGSIRLLRGGAWKINSSYCRAAFRSYYTSPESRNAYRGFRVVCDLD